MAEMVERPDLQAVLRDRPVEVTSVCKCAEQEFAKDTKIRDFFDVPKAVLAEQMKSEHAKSYVMLRVASSLFGCLAPEFEKTLDASSPIARAPVTQTPTEQPSSTNGIDK